MALPDGNTWASSMGSLSNFPASLTATHMDRSSSSSMGGPAGFPHGQ